MEKKMVEKERVEKERVEERRVLGLPKLVFRPSSFP